MGIRADLLDCIKDFIKTHGHEPEKLCLTAEDELALATMSLDEAGGPVSGNVREDWKLFDGKEVVWAAAVRKCE